MCYNSNIERDGQSRPGRGVAVVCTLMHKRIFVAGIDLDELAEILAA